MPKPQTFPPVLIPISDGYTQSLYIRGVPGLHGPIKGRYRPVGVQVAGQIFTASQLLADDGKRYAHQAECIVRGKFLVEWDVTDNKSNPVPITAKALLQMQRAAFFRLISIIMGNEASDAEDSPHLDGETTDDLVAMSLQGIDEPAELVHEKNSVAG